MNYSAEQLKTIRQKMIRLEGYSYDFTRRDMCVSDLIRFATDDSILGFEDPKSKADDILSSLAGGSGRIACWRENCSYSVTYNSRKVEAKDEAGLCAIKTLCTKQALENDSSKLEETSVVVRSSEQIGFVCVKSSCEFTCGYTIDGNSGQHGVCQKEMAEE